MICEYLNPHHLDEETDAVYTCHLLAILAFSAAFLFVDFLGWDPVRWLSGTQDVSMSFELFVAIMTPNPSAAQLFRGEKD